MKKMDWKKIAAGIVLLIGVIAGAYSSKTLTAQDVQKIFDGAALIVDGVDETDDVPVVPVPGQDETPLP